MLALDDYVHYILSHQVTTGHTVDARENRVPITETRTLTVVMQPKAAARTVYQTGADETVMQVEGACYEPRLMPREVTQGQSFDLRMDGRKARLTIRLLPRRPLAELDLELGQSFEAEVKFVA